MSKKEKKQKKIDDWGTDIKLDIPEDEIWTYRVPGLAAPHINKPYKYYNLKKALFVISIIIAVSLSIYFSILALQNETFEYTQLENGYEFSKFSNTGYLYELDIDYVSDIEYIAGNNDPATNFKVVKDESKPIVSVRQFTLNCDDKIRTITIGANVEFVDTKAFYSCWALQNIEVDENNPNYCDIDGVLYSKDGSVLIAYPKSKLGDSFTLPNGVITISSQAFCGTVNLVTLTIGHRVTVCDEAFYNCEKLQNIIFMSNETSSFIGNQTFVDCALENSIIVWVPTGTIDAYKNAVIEDITLYSKFREGTPNT
jgi:hypothetical protein